MGFFGWLGDLFVGDWTPDDEPKSSGWGLDHGSSTKTETQEAIDQWKQDNANS